MSPEAPWTFSAQAVASSLLPRVARGAPPGREGWSVQMEDNDDDLFGPPPALPSDEEDVFNLGGSMDEPGHDDPGSQVGSASAPPCALTEEQRDAVDRVAHGRNVFLTGPAGTGKSVVLRAIILQCRNQHGDARVGVTGSTGLAAFALGGATVHAWAGLPLEAETMPRLALERHARSLALDTLQTARVLIIDEVSMLSGALLDALERVLRDVRASETPFGGVQVVLCGDMAQLPPVSADTGGYLFEAVAWGMGGFAANTALLTEVHRQKGDEVYARLLGELRVGNCPQWCLDALDQCARDRKPLPSGDAPPAIRCKNREVDETNARRLGELEGQGQTYPTEGGDVCLKVGALVISMAKVESVPPGSRGVVDMLGETSVRVRFADALLDVWPVAGLMPLRLAWALTVHKCQGMSLDAAEVDVGDAFASGHVYTALSRVRSLAGLYLTAPFRAGALRLAPKVAAFLRTLEASRVGPPAPAPPPAPAAATASRTTLEELRVKFASDTERERGLRTERNASNRRARQLQLELAGLKRDVGAFRTASRPDLAAEAEQNCARFASLRQPIPRQGRVGLLFSA